MFVVWIKPTFTLAVQAEGYHGISNKNIDSANRFISHIHIYSMFFLWVTSFQLKVNFQIMRFSSPICIKKSELQGSWILNSTFYQTGLPSRLTVELKPQYWNVGPQKPHHVCHSFCSYITTRLRVSLNFWLILQYAFLQTPQDAVLLFPSTLHLYRKVLCKSARYITKDF